MTLVASIAGRLGGSASRGRGLRVALEVARVPVAARRALGRWAARRLRSRGNAALLARVPVPAVSRARCPGRRAGRVGVSTVRKATALQLEARKACQRYCSTSLNKALLQELAVLAVTAARRSSRGRWLRWGGRRHRSRSRGRRRRTLAVQVKTAPKAI